MRDYVQRLIAYLQNNAPEHILTSVPGRFPALYGFAFSVAQPCCVPLSSKSLLHSVQGSAACGKVYAALQITGVGGAQRPSQLISMVEPSVKEPDAIMTRRYSSVRLPVRADSCPPESRTDAAQNPCSAAALPESKQSHNIVMVGGIAGHGVHPASSSRHWAYGGFSASHTNAGGVIKPRKYHAGCPACNQTPCRCRGR